MANIKISELPAVAAGSGTQEFETNDSGTSKKVTGAQLKTYVKDGLAVSDISDLTATATELNTLDGITGIASQAQAEAGTNNTTLMTPLKTKQTFLALNKPFLGNTQILSTNKTLIASDSSDLLVCSNSIDVTLPSVSEGLVFGFVNNSDNYIVINPYTSSTEIGRQTGGILLDSRQEAIVVCDGIKWHLFGVNDKLKVVSTTFTSSGTFTPNPAAKMFLACVGGATGGTTANVNAKGGSGGGGYSEKLYTTPFLPSYTVTIGAGGAVGATGGTTTFGTMTIASSLGAGVNVGTAGGVGTGGTFNATGGTGGNPNTNSGGGGGGGGGAATRAGNGGNGGNGAISGVYGGGGGTGGNNATGNIGGAAATSISASAYSLTAFANSFTFDAGPSGYSGGKGASSYNTYTKNGSSFSIGGYDLSCGRSGNLQGVASGYAGFSGYVTILEIF